MVRGNFSKNDHRCLCNRQTEIRLENPATKQKGGESSQPLVLKKICQQDSKNGWMEAWLLEPIILLLIFRTDFLAHLNPNLKFQKTNSFAINSDLQGVTEPPTWGKPFCVACWVMEGRKLSYHINVQSHCDQQTAITPVPQVDQLVPLTNITVLSYNKLRNIT